MKRLKCYNTYLVDPLLKGSLLVFHCSPNEARAFSCSAGFWEMHDYLDIRAKRVPELDQYAGDKPHYVETNDDLPDGVDFYEFEV